MEVILTTQNLICRFPKAFSRTSMQRRRSVRPHSANQNLGGPWDLLIKVVGLRKRTRRVALAYEAINLQGLAIFSGGTSCVATNTSAATQDALVEAALTTRRLGFFRILFLCSNSSIVQACNSKCTTNWQEMTIVANLIALQQQGLVCKAFRALALGGVYTLPVAILEPKTQKKDILFGYGFL